MTLNLIAQIGVSNTAPNNDPNHLINNIFIGGGVSVSNIAYSGNNQQIGYFASGASIGMPEGIVRCIWNRIIPTHCKISNCRSSKCIYIK